MKSNKLTLVFLTTLLAVTVIFSAMAAASTQHDYVVSLIKSAGMKDAMLGTSDDRDALAKSLGFFNNWNYEPEAVTTAQVEASMDAAMAGAVNGLRGALDKKPMEPYFVNGMAQPIFYYGNSRYNDTTGEGVIRFVVYVESDLDTDNDGKLDLVKVLVQLPRAALDGAKFSTVYEARPYIEGTGSQSVPSATQTAGNTYLSSNPTFSHTDLYKTAAPRIRTGEATLEDMVANAKFTDWYYKFSYNSAGNGSATIAPGNLTDETEYEDLNWYDYFLVRGFAVVQSAGIGSAGSEGYASCGADIEVNAFRCVIEWLTGERRAFTDKVSNVEIKADWSNGNVGMTGRSYAGTTQFGLATSGVNGLKTIVPVAGIASWYEYTNGQGVAISNAYVTGLAWYVNSRLAASDWNTVFNRYAGFSQLMRNEENALVGDYGPHWARRDYTVENWFRDWGPSKIQIPMLIVHGGNDDNVRPKQSVLMYQAAKKAGVPVKWIWHQGHHMTPTFPRATPNANDTYRPYSMYCGDYTYDEWLNMWFSHHLYNLNNDIMTKLPGVLALDNSSGEWVSYDSWDSPNSVIVNKTNQVGGLQPRALSARVYEEPENYSVDNPLLDHTPLDAAKNNKPGDQGIIMPAATLSAFAQDNLSVINSANGSTSWQNFLDAPTAGSMVYHLDLTDDLVIKGVVKVNVRAAVNSASADEPLRMHAKLVEVAAPGTTLKYFGGNSMGSTVGVTTIKAGGSWQGGGIASHNLVRFNQASTGTYREIGKGWIDLNNPSAGYDSHTADRNNRIVARENLNVYHDYSVYLQPAIHTAKKGNKLALIITTGSSGTNAYTLNNAYTFTIDNDATNVVIPSAFSVVTVDASLAPATTTVTAGKITGSLTVTASATMGAKLSYQWFSNTADSNVGGTAISGETAESFTIPTTLTEGVYYYFCEVSAAGADSVRTNVGTVTVNKSTIIIPLPDDPGCNAGYGYLLFALMGIAPFILSKRSR